MRKITKNGIFFIVFIFLFLFSYEVKANGSETSVVEIKFSYSDNLTQECPSFSVWKYFPCSIPFDNYNLDCFFSSVTVDITGCVTGGNYPGSNNWGAGLILPPANYTYDSTPPYYGDSPQTHHLKQISPPDLYRLNNCEGFRVGGQIAQAQAGVPDNPPNGGSYSISGKFRGTTLASFPPRIVKVDDDYMLFIEFDPYFNSSLPAQFFFVNSKGNSFLIATETLAPYQLGINSFSIQSVFYGIDYSKFPVGEYVLRSIINPGTSASQSADIILPSSLFLPSIKNLSITPNQFSLDDLNIHKKSFLIQATMDKLGPATISFYVTPFGTWNSIDLGEYSPKNDSFSFTWDGILKGEETPIPGSYTLEAYSGGPLSKHVSFEILESPASVVSVSANPSVLVRDLVGRNKAPITFQAITSAIGSVTFKVDGDKITTVPSTKNNDEFVAECRWYGSASIASGQHKISASIGESKEVLATFSVEISENSFVGTGNSSSASNDPADSVVPKSVSSTAPKSTVFIPDNSNIPPTPSIGDPVNLVSGNYMLSENDLTLNSRLPINLMRVYNSLDSQIGIFGRGWSSTCNSHLEFLANSVVFIKSDGSQILYNKQGTTYKPVNGTDLKLSVAISTGIWSVSNPQGASWSFNKQGKILSINTTYCVGASTTINFEYNASGTLLREINPAGQWFGFEYNSSGLVSRVTDSTNRIVDYSYDQFGNLVKFTDPLSRSTLYSYDANNQLNKVERPGNRVTSIAYSQSRATTVTSPTGSTYNYVWDLINRNLSFTDPVGTVHEYNFSPSWQLVNYSVPSKNITKTFTMSDFVVTSFENSQGARETFAYNSDSLLVSQTNAQGNVTQYAYHPKFYTLTKKTNTLGSSWLYNWDSRANLITETDPKGGITSYTYDVYNNRTSLTTPLGKIFKYDYSKDGNFLLKITNPLGGIFSFLYDLRGNLTSSRDPLNRVTTFQYDDLNRLIKASLPDGRWYELEYDECGNLVKRTDNLNRATCYSYDLDGNLISLQRPDGSKLTYEYNSVGQKIAEIDPLQKVTKLEYDAVGNLNKIIYPDGVFEGFNYDTEGNLISRVNELGEVTNFEYDVIGRLIATIDPTGARWEATYDSNNRKLTDKDPLGRLTYYSYDVLDRVTTIKRADGSKTGNEYDAVGNLLRTTDAVGATWTWQYDALDRQIKAIRPDGASQTVVYDAAGQIIQESDFLGRLTKNTYNSVGQLLTSTDPIGAVWKYKYDQAGRLFSITNPLGAVATMGYDVMNRLTLETVPLGAVATTGAPLGSQTEPLWAQTKHVYDLIGRQTGVIDPAGHETTFSYDTRNRLISETDPASRTVSYGYDSAGRRVSLQDGAGRVWRWEYDQVGRVVSEINPVGGLTAFTYDAVGNCTKTISAKKTEVDYEFNKTDLLSKVRYSGGNIATFAYDPEGREISRSGYGFLVTKSWSKTGDLLSEKFGPYNKIWNYQYDASGNRIAAVSPEGVAFKYIYDKANRLSKFGWSQTGDDVSYAYDLIGRVTTLTRQGVISEFTYDRAGQVLELSHKNKNTSELIASRKYSYDIVGNPISVMDEDKGVTTLTYDASGWLKSVVSPDKVNVSY
ncbi:MAG: hypothetical protein HQM08_22330, partial [Candidatus Riflebacteria bacterium]|nr:hypothetical protein [Candidatus Riflebacteria bacterium]